MDLVPQENIINIRHSNLLIFIIDLLRYMAKCRRLGIDTLVDMEFFTRSSAIISYLSGARKRVGYHRFTSEYPYRGNLFSHRVQYNPYLHTAQAYTQLARCIDMDPREIPLAKLPLGDACPAPPLFQAGTEEKEELTDILKAEGWTGQKPLILLNPNASDMLPLRKWPEENFIALGRRLLARYPEGMIIITGSSEEEKAAADIARAIDPQKAISLAGKTTLRQVIILYSLADLLITNDSGPGHFASLTHIRSIVMFGPETPALFGPLGGNATVVWARLACSPCVNVFNHRFSPCRDNRCMQAISVDKVLELAVGELEG
jgi:ADP-heptose:LPS heptosyltransferase